MTDIVLIGTATIGQQEAASPLTFSYDLVSDNNRMMLLAVTSHSTSAPTFTATYNGISLLLNANVRNNNLNTATFQLLDADMPAAGVNDIVVSWTGGANMQIIAVVETAANAEQINIGGVLFESGTVGNGTVIATNIDAPDNSWSFAAVNAQINGESWIHNNSADEVMDIGTFDDFTASVTSTIYETGITAAFDSEQSGSNARLQRHHLIVEEEPIVVTALATTITALSEVFPALTRFKGFASTTTVVSNVDPNEFIYFRTHSTTVAAVSTVAGTVARMGTYESLTSTVSALTVAPFERAAELRAIVVNVSAITATLGARDVFFASVTNAVAVITPSFGNTFNENISSLTPGCYVELFEIDTTDIGGGDIFRFVPGGFDVAEVEWQGNTYTRFPVVVEGFEWNATSQAPPQPELTLSNVNKFVLAAVINLGDLVGAKVTRWRTYQQYLDGQEQADANAHFPPDIFFVQQKTSHNKEQMTWTLSSALDIPGVRLPKRQILRDQTTGNLYAPGVSKVRFKGR